MSSEPTPFHRVRLAFAVAACVALPGCASLVDGATQRFADNLGKAVLDADDPATVRSCWMA
jgi:uncharacterized heparinase superfamily protein